MIFRVPNETKKAGGGSPLSPKSPAVKLFRDRKVRARLLNRTLENNNNENMLVTSPVSKPKRRVFRCLLNMKPSSPKVGGESNNSTEHSYINPSISTTAQLDSLISSAHEVPPSPPPAASRRKAESRGERRYCSLIDRSTEFALPLKFEKVEAAPAADACEEPKRKRKIRFGEEVAIVKILSHRHYPNHIKQTVWGSRKEIKANAVRNTQEYIFDKCDWRNCTEESGMYIDERIGKLVHPVHVHRFLQEQARRSQQQQKQQMQQLQHMAPPHPHMINAMPQRQVAPQTHYAQHPWPCAVPHSCPPQTPLQEELRCRKRMQANNRNGPSQPTHIPQIV